VTRLTVMEGRLTRIQPLKTRSAYVKSATRSVFLLKERTRSFLGHLTGCRQLRIEFPSGKHKVFINGGKPMVNGAEYLTPIKNFDCGHFR
jgi:hypothetical protein